MQQAQILQVNTSEFRTKIKNYIDMVDDGVRIILKRNHNKYYLITPINDDDLWLTPNVQAKIDRALEQVKNGEVVEYTPELENELFGKVL
ncbi:MAG: hypothetical protein LBG17_03335 [Bacteroidales bacterium]|jgi:PHD/YefM family antitoxin component YafN of YafNO toxin-antitoxin module|nr:hypothetical protein [Bacteroidales bacterium]